MMNKILLQVQHAAEMADAQGDGKLMVVVGVISVIFAGIVFYLFRLDKKISHLENESKSTK